MSFGFAVGDFIAVGELILHITQSLRDVGGAKSDYQELVRELESLDKALKHVDRLKGPTADSIKCAALMCRYPLEDFLNKIKKFEDNLGVGSSIGHTKSIGRKLHWSLGKKDEISRLRDYLNLHIGSINMQLLTAGLEILDAKSHGAGDQQLEIRRNLEESRAAIANLGARVQNQSLIAQCTRNAVGTLFAMVRLDVVAPLNDLIQVVTRVCAATQEIYFTILEIRTNMTSIDTGYTFFQAPIKVEDALGRIWPVPSEYSVSDLHAIIHSKFVAQPVLAEIEAGNYELFNQKDSQQIIAANSGVGLLPGMSITMAVVIQTTAGRKMCPLPSCGAHENTKMPGGGRQCKACGVCFDLTQKKRKRPGAPSDDAKLLEHNPQGFQSTSEDEPEEPIRPIKSRKICVPNVLKNIRIPKEPDPTNMRIWHSRAGKFEVSAEFLALEEGEGPTVILHKYNGVRIHVPIERLSAVDVAYVASLPGISLDSDALQTKTDRRTKRAKRPVPQNTRIWIDRTGNFTVEAAIQAVQDDCVHLHKVNGVKIKVPLSKISLRDLEYINQEWEQSEMDGGSLT